MEPIQDLIINHMAKIRNCHPNMAMILSTTHGSLGLFFLIESFYPFVEAYHKNGMIAIELDGLFYNIHGRIDDSNGYQKVMQSYETHEVKEFLEEIDQYYNRGSN